jgi:hypothetical protein
MQGHLSQERRDSPLPLAGQHIPNRRRQIAHPGIQANGPKRIALQTRFSAIRCVPSIYERYREWDIEQLFRAMKTQGFDVEGLRIEEETPLRNLAMAIFIAAVVVQQLVHARDGAGEQGSLRPITDAFEPEDQPLLEAFSAKLEGKTQKQRNPHPRGSLAYASWVCARLGGWNCYYGKPGPITMLNGWREFQAAKKGVALLRGAIEDV